MVDFGEAVVTLAAVILTTIKSNGGCVGFPYQILEDGLGSHRNSWKMH